MKDNRVYKYNSNWQIIGKESVKKAVKKVYKGRALFLNKDTGETFTFDKWLKLDPTSNFITISPFGRIRRPMNIVCSFYKGMGMSPRHEDPRFGRWNIFVRDNGRCCFCGKPLLYQQGGFTLDHVHPESKGGEKDWFNIVLACHQCNHKKGNKSIEECGLTLLHKPYKPTAEELRGKSIKVRQEIWKNEENKQSNGD